MEKIVNIKLEEEDILKLIAEKYGCSTDDVMLKVDCLPLFMNGMNFGNTYVTTAFVTKTSVKD